MPSSAFALGEKASQPANNTNVIFLIILFILIPLYIFPYLFRDDKHI